MRKMNFGGCWKSLMPQYLPKISAIPLLFLLIYPAERVHAQESNLEMHYTLTMPDPGNHLFEVDLVSKGWKGDSALLRMPQWSPGYYQIMNYGEQVKDFKASNSQGHSLPVRKPDDHSWKIGIPAGGSFRIHYSVLATRRFVANSFLDSSHAYVIPASVFLYGDNHLQNPVSLQIQIPAAWKQVATGLELQGAKKGAFKAPNFDVFYDCPILIGNLESLPSFRIGGIEHRFIGYKMSDFNHTMFMTNLQKVVQAAVNIIGEIPYKQYTFIGIGPGRGGIEHLNSTTVSFDGRGLDTKQGLVRTMNFLAHEYFHNYNVKRIRPFELGPFNYNRANRTNLLWVSEGLSVYYEYLVVKRAGLIDAATLFHNFEGSINAFENDPGKPYQSLVQASYETWSDGPFGRQGQEGDKSISYYDKGPAVGLILDLAIRHATDNRHSLDDVMRYLYYHYYKALHRGFTDAEFQQACESIAGTSLSPEFEYVYTTKPLDYDHYLAYAGLKIDSQKDPGNGRLKFSITRVENPDAAQQAIQRSWLGEK